MKQHIVSSAIVLKRTDYQEADRIITVLTSEHGKRTLIAKGVRKSRSKLAGGIELFSISNLAYIPGKGDIDTLVSSRLETHYGSIVQRVERTMAGYEFLKRMHRATEEDTELDHFEVLQRSLESLNDLSLQLTYVQMWFAMQMLRLAGHMPNLITDNQNLSLEEASTYSFDYSDMQFTHANDGYSAQHIKLLRLSASIQSPIEFKKLQADEQAVALAAQLADRMYLYYMPA